MKSLNQIIENIALDIMKEPGTKVEVMKDIGYSNKGDILTIKNINFPWIRFEEIGDGWPFQYFRKIEQ